VKSMGTRTRPRNMAASITCGYREGIAARGALPGRPL